MIRSRFREASRRVAFDLSRAALMLTVHPPCPGPTREGLATMTDPTVEPAPAPTFAPLELQVSTFGKWMALLAALLGWLFDGLEMGLFPLVQRPALLELLPAGTPILPW